MKHTPGPVVIRFMDPNDLHRGFFIEAKRTLPENKPEIPYGIEILGDDFGEHNGYPDQQRLADAELMVEAINLSTELGATPRDMFNDLKDVILVLNESPIATTEWFQKLKAKLS